MLILININLTAEDIAVFALMMESRADYIEKESYPNFNSFRYHVQEISKV